METLQQLLQHILHIDIYLNNFVSAYGVWTYIVLFTIIFCETGLVITPFLPGDSLLFAAGSIAANENNTLDVVWLIVLLTLASILGNQMNYWIGRRVGPRVFSSNGRLLNKKYLLDTHKFYEKHGGKTIIIARFLPIIRTFAPFVAGVGYMSMQRFFLYNVASAVLWIGSLVSAGYFFGSLPIIKDNFSIVIYGIIAISVLPPAIAIIYRKLQTS